MHENRGTLGRHWKDNEQKGKLRALEPMLDRNEIAWNIRLQLFIERNKIAWDIRLQLFVASTYLFTITIQETPGEPSFSTSTKHVA